jgi:adenylate cyclase class IV
MDAIFRKAAALAEDGPFEIIQDDTFFACNNGRLKLRAFSADKGELIFYRRTNQKGPKESFYIVSQSASPDTLRECLSLAYGQVGRVRKNRTLFLSGRTRIHLDRVEGLGEFLELEVMLADGEQVETGGCYCKRPDGEAGYSTGSAYRGSIRRFTGFKNCRTKRSHRCHGCSRHIRLQHKRYLICSALHELTPVFPVSLD